jgi:hypothetical protein
MTVWPEYLSFTGQPREPEIFTGLPPETGRPSHLRRNESGVIGYGRVIAVSEINGGLRSFSGRRFVLTIFKK